MGTKREGESRLGSRGGRDRWGFYHPLGWDSPCGPRPVSFHPACGAELKEGKEIKRTLGCGAGTKEGEECQREIEETQEAPRIG